MNSVIQTHSNQDNPSDVPETKIVSAYGLRKCPKLVEQVRSENVDVRVNALAVVCDEFSNPYSIQGCMKAGLAQVLAKMISDPDFLTRERATRALAMAAEDANGAFAEDVFEVEHQPFGEGRLARPADGQVAQDQRRQCSFLRGQDSSIVKPVPGADDQAVQLGR